MAKKELDFLDKYCRNKKIERETYEPFCDLIVKLHDCNTSAATVFWHNVNNLIDMKKYQYKHLNITKDEKIEIIKAGFNHLIEGNGWITKTKVLSLYKNNPVFNIDTLKHFNQIFKKNGFDCEVAIGLCQAPVNEDLEEEYMAILSMMFNQYSENKLLQDWDKLGKISVNYANNLYRMMQQSSINDPDVGILERMMIANAWLHNKIKKIACIQEQNSESSEMIKDIRKNFAKEIQIKISQKLIADQLFTKCKSLFHKEYNDFELKIKPLSKEINKFNNRCGELKNKIKKAKKAKQYDEKKLYEKELDDLMKNNGNIEATKKEVDRFKKEQFDFINQKVMQELKKYY